MQRQLTVIENSTNKNYPAQSSLRSNSTTDSSKKKNKRTIFLRAANFFASYRPPHLKLNSAKRTFCFDIVLPVVFLLGIPSITYGSFFPADSFLNYFIAIWSAWDGLLSIGSFVLITLAISGSFLYAHWVPAIPPNNNNSTKEGLICGSLPQTQHESLLSKNEKECNNHAMKHIWNRSMGYAFSTRTRLFHIIAFAQLLFVLFLIGVLGPNTLVYPSWLWHPLLWGTYHVYNVKDVPKAVGKICLDKLDREDLCLDESEWNLLSAGALSRHNGEDVRGVIAGKHFAKNKSIVINILARDIKRSIPALRINIESLAPFFQKVVLVVFENDSSDGTRDQFKKWAVEASSEYKGYEIDLMECEESAGCKFHLSYRDDVAEESYDYSSAIGNMHIYRNRAMQYITTKYHDFNHILVLDVDLAVPFSPLGILHTLGHKPDHAVASSGRQPWPTAFGSFLTPYDLNGFRELNSPRTKGLEVWHRRFCNIAPPGERWHSECDALSPSHLVAILWNDRRRLPDKEDFYPVNSAFNGAVLYPMNLIKKSGAVYDNGDGQRCEHVGFHAAISKIKAVLVNRKWDMHLDPNFPGGAAWGRAKKVLIRVTSNPKLMLTVFLSHVVTVGIFVWSTFTLGVSIVQPGALWVLRTLVIKVSSNKRRE